MNLGWGEVIDQVAQDAFTVRQYKKLLPSLVERRDPGDLVWRYAVANGARAKMMYAMWREKMLKYLWNGQRDSTAAFVKALRLALSPEMSEVRRASRDAFPDSRDLVHKLLLECIFMQRAIYLA